MSEVRHPIVQMLNTSVTPDRLPPWDNLGAVVHGPIRDSIADVTETHSFLKSLDC